MVGRVTVLDGDEVDTTRGKSEPGLVVMFEESGETRLILTRHSTAQKIFAHLLTFGPSPQELVEWMANPDEIDRRVQNTEMAMMIAKGAQQQRNGVLASLGLIADSLRMLPERRRLKPVGAPPNGPNIGRDGSFLPRNRASARHCDRSTAYGSTCSCCVS